MTRGARVSGYAPWYYRPVRRATQFIAIRTIANTSGGSSRLIQVNGLPRTAGQPPQAR